MARKRIRFSDQLRKAIEASEMSRYEIGQETDIDPATLCRFMHDEGGLSMDGLDRIADCLGLNLSTETKPRKARGRKPKGG